MIKWWVAEFSPMRKPAADDLRSGKPQTSTTGENIDLALNMIMDVQRLLKRAIAARAGISQECADHILHNELEMSEVSER